MPARPRSTLAAGLGTATASLVACGAVLTAGAATAQAAQRAPARTTATKTTVLPDGIVQDPSPAPGTLANAMMPPGSPDAGSAMSASPATSGLTARAATTCGGLGPSATASMPRGVDVADYQHPGGASVDWSQVKAAGRTFVVVKATEFTGSSSVYTNPYLATDIAGARAAGLYVGLYSFARPQYSPIAQADVFGADFNIVGGTLLPPVLDLEANGGLSPSALVSWTRRFLTELQRVTGRQPMIYTGPSFWQSSLGNSTAFTSYPLWAANYTTCSTPQRFGGWSSWSLWQYDDGAYAETAPIAGISATVDRDVAASGTTLDTLATGTFLGTASAAQFPEGSLVRLAGSPAVYRVVGGSPQYVSSWAAIGGPKPVRDVPAKQFFTMRGTPRDGTFVDAGGSVYRIAGGAPTYVSNWTAVGGFQPYQLIDPADIVNAGSGGYYGHLHATPADGTFVRTRNDGAVYEIAGGAPVRVNSWVPFGGGKPSTDIDPAAISHAGLGGAWRFLLPTPADGTFVATIQDGAVFRMAGGAPLYVSNWNVFGGPQPTVRIDKTAVDEAGRGGFWNHIRQRPAEGTFLNGVQSGAVYRVDVNGHPVYVSSWTPYGGVQRFTDVDQNAITNMGGAGVYSHLAR